jgi:hypothetical protein
MGGSGHPWLAEGGPAFPIGDRESDTSFKGMSLRDYFAAAALQGMSANTLCNDWPPEILAKTAYQQADAMLAAREAKP